MCGSTLDKSRVANNSFNYFESGKTISKTIGVIQGGRKPLHPSTKKRDGLAILKRMAKAPLWPLQ